MFPRPLHRAKSLSMDVSRAQPPINESSDPNAAAGSGDSIPAARRSHARRSSVSGFGMSLISEHAVAAVLEEPKPLPIIKQGSIIHTIQTDIAVDTAAASQSSDPAASGPPALSRRLSRAGSMLRRTGSIVSTPKSNGKSPGIAAAPDADKLDDTPQSRRGSLLKSSLSKRGSLSTRSPLMPAPAANGQANTIASAGANSNVTSNANTGSVNRRSSLAASPQPPVSPSVESLLRAPSPIPKLVLDPRSFGLTKFRAIAKKVVARNRLAQTCRTILHKQPRLRTDSDINTLESYIKSLNSPFFNQYDSSTIRLLCSKMRIEYFPQNATVMKEGDVSDRLFIILSGTVTIWVGVSGSSWGVSNEEVRDISDAHLEFVRSTFGKSIKFLNIHHAGGSKVIFGELGLINGTRRSASILAYNDCEFLTITSPVFNAVLAQREKEKLMENIGQLQRFQLFSNVSERHLIRLSYYFTQREYSPQSFILHQGERIGYIYFIAEGQCELLQAVGNENSSNSAAVWKIMKTPSSSQLLSQHGLHIAVIGEGENFGEAAMFTSANVRYSTLLTQPYSVRALTRVRVFMIPHEDLLKRTRADILNAFKRIARAKNQLHEDRIKQLREKKTKMTGSHGGGRSSWGTESMSESAHFSARDRAFDGEEKRMEIGNSALSKGFSLMPKRTRRSSVIISSIAEALIQPNTANAATASTAISLPMIPAASSGLNSNVAAAPSSTLSNSHLPSINSPLSNSFSAVQSGSSSSASSGSSYSSHIIPQLRVARHGIFGDQLPHPLVPSKVQFQSEKQYFHQWKSIENQIQSASYLSPAMEELNWLAQERAWGREKAILPEMRAAAGEKWFQPPQSQIIFPTFMETELRAQTNSLGEALESAISQLDVKDDQGDEASHSQPPPLIPIDNMSYRFYPKGQQHLDGSSHFGSFKSLSPSNAGQSHRSGDWKDRDAAKPLISPRDRDRSPSPTIAQSQSQDHNASPTAAAIASESNEFLHFFSTSSSRSRSTLPDSTSSPILRRDMELVDSFINIEPKIVHLTAQNREASAIAASVAQVAAQFATGNPGNRSPTKGSRTPVNGNRSKNASPIASRRPSLVSLPTLVRPAERAEKAYSSIGDSLAPEFSGIGMKHHDGYDSSDSPIASAPVSPSKAQQNTASGFPSHPWNYNPVASVPAVPALPSRSVTDEYSGPANNLPLFHYQSMFQSKSDAAPVHSPPKPFRPANSSLDSHSAAPRHPLSFSLNLNAIHPKSSSAAAIRNSLPIAAVDRNATQFPLTERFARPQPPEFGSGPQSARNLGSRGGYATARNQKSTTRGDSGVQEEKEAPAAKAKTVSVAKQGRGDSVREQQKLKRAQQVEAARFFRNGFIGS